MRVYKINQEGLGGTLYLREGDLKEAEDVLEPMEIGNKYTIEVIEMLPQEYDKLGEFECFE